MPEAFVEGPIDGVEVRPLAARADARGWLVEIFRQDEMDEEHWPVMAYLSQTEPGACRGPHEHAEQADRFAFLGPGNFTLYLWDIRADSPTWGCRMTLVVGESNRQTVLVPPGVVHAYKNPGDRPAWMMNFPNCLYAGPGRNGPVDEIRYEDRGETIFEMD